MSVILAAELNKVLDACVKFGVKLVGASDYGVGVAGGAWGATGAIADLKAAIVADLSDVDPIAALVGPVQNLEASVSGIGLAANNISPVLSALQGHVTRYSLPNVRSLDDYLTYLNVSQAAKWQALQHPFWKSLATQWGASASVWNCYFEVLQGAAYPNALAKFVVGPGFTAGQAIDSGSYAGGFPQIYAQGVAGAGLVTVTGTAYDPATKTAAAGYTWTCTVNANGRFGLAGGGANPAPANSLILAVSSVAAAAGLTAATLYIEAARPAGRPLIS